MTVSNQVSVHFLPDLTTPEQLADATVVVIDVLRASTTITWALASGAACVIPCLEVEQARAKAAEIKSDVLLGGERFGERIEGFDLGNSPTEYSAEIVDGKTIVFTTTNGTQAMSRCSQAKEVLIGSFVNLSAIFDRVEQANNLHLLCAGTHGEISQEDILFAGAVTTKLTAGKSLLALNDQAQIAAAYWQNAVGFECEDMTKRIVNELRQSRGGRNLQKIGLDADVHVAAKVDQLQLVPRLDIGSWIITKD